MADLASLLAEPSASAVPPVLTWTNRSTDALIAASYVLIFSFLFWSASKLQSLPALKAYMRIVTAFGVLIAASSVAHAAWLLTAWWPISRVLVAAKILFAAAAVVTAVLLARATPRLTENIQHLLESLARAQRRIEDDGASYRAVLEAINRSQMMIEFDLDGHILRANENYLSAFGMTETDVAGKDHSLFVPAADRESAAYKEFWHRLREGRFQAGQFRRHGLDGAEVWIEASYNPIFGPDGAPVKIVKFASDITDRIKIQWELQDAEAGLRAILDNVLDGILTFDELGRIVSINPAIERMFGYQAEELIGQDITTLMPENRSLVTAASGAAKAVRVGHEQKGHTRAGVTFPIEWTVTEVSFRGQRMFVGLVRDITERKRAEDVSRQARGIAELANRTKSDFLANMSHEIRTPMNAILGMTYLAMRAAPTLQQRGYLTKIGTAAQSLLSIVNGILDFSKIEAGKLELERISFSLGEVLTNLVDIVGAKAEEKGLALVFSVAEEVPRLLLGDPLRLGQILINLVNNAIKFTDAGEIVIKVQAEEVSRGHARLVLSVSDTGIGMSSQQIANLFQSFNQADTSFTRRYGGTGLGLAISKQLCELMGGGIAVESTIGHGSTFVVTVHLGVASAMAQEQANGTGQERKRSVLVVEDVESERNVLVTMLHAHGLNARGVSSAEEALSGLVHGAQIGNPFDLVLMDWQLPGIDGIEASRRIKMHPTLTRIPAILMISAFECAEVMAGLSELSFDGYLVKPIHEAVLSCAVASLCGETAADLPRETQPAENSLPEHLIGRKVLLVEDNEINQDLATELMQDLGVEVAVAANGREGVDRVFAQSFDLVLMDIQMPVMDGLAATRMIRANGRFQSLPIIAMTAHAMRGDRERSLFAGMNDHLTKPINPEQLRRTLARWLPPRAPAPEPAAPRNGLPERLPPFNLQAALARANGKETLLRTMIGRFHTSYAEAGAALRSQIGAKKIEDAHRFAHSLKGVAATLEAGELSAAAAALEQALAGQQQDGQPLGRPQMEAVDALIDRLEVALKPALAAAASLNGTDSPPANNGASPASNGALSSEQSTRPSLLFVDDEPSSIDILADTFADEYDLLSASDGVTALRIAASRRPDLILLDVLMPGIDGYEVCRRLKREERTSNIGVIFITSRDSVIDETKGLELGAVDYVSKPINTVAVKARVGNQIKLKRAQDALSLLAATDALTGLANRRRFDEMLAYEYARHTRSGTDLSLILMDIDYFKNFNDHYGHVAGDECLRQVARVVGGVMARATDLVARFGGEEFVFLLPETDLNGAVIFAERIRRSVADLALPHAYSKIADHLTVSLGALSVRQLPHRSLSSLVAQADAQLYAAKAGGRNRVCAAEAV
jgi:two-component system, sensor histidine kinase and response regulator